MFPDTWCKKTGTIIPAMFIYLYYYILSHLDSVCGSGSRRSTPQCRLLVAVRPTQRGSPEFLWRHCPERSRRTTQPHSHTRTERPTAKRQGLGTISTQIPAGVHYLWEIKRSHVGRVTILTKMNKNQSEVIHEKFHDRKYMDIKLFVYLCCWVFTKVINWIFSVFNAVLLER